MKSNGLNVNAEAIGEGIYRMICERGEESVVAFGMIPKWAIDCLEKLLREKILSVVREQNGLKPSDEFPSYLKIDEAKVSQMIREISHAVVLAIYGAAKNAGAMVC